MKVKAVVHFQPDPRPKSLSGYKSHPKGGTEIAWLWHGHGSLDLDWFKLL